MADFQKTTAMNIMHTCANKNNVEHHDNIFFNHGIPGDALSNHGDFGTLLKLS